MSQYRESSDYTDLVKSKALFIGTFGSVLSNTQGASGETLAIQLTTSDTFLTGDLFQLKIYGNTVINDISITNTPVIMGSIFTA
jgi:hypothetical protein